MSDDTTEFSDVFPEEPHEPEQKQAGELGANHAPASESEGEPSPAAAPASESAPEPAIEFESIPEPMSEPVPEPAAEPAAEPALASDPESMPEAVPAFEPVPAGDPVFDSAAGFESEPEEAPIPVVPINVPEPAPEETVKVYRYTASDEDEEELEESDDYVTPKPAGAAPVSPIPPAPIAEPALFEPAQEPASAAPAPEAAQAASEPASEETEQGVPESPVALEPSADPEPLAVPITAIELADSAAQTDAPFTADEQQTPAAPSVIETASATTDREAARSTGPLPFIITGVTLGLVLLVSTGMMSCTASMARWAMDDMVDGGHYTYNYEPYSQQYLDEEFNDFHHIMEEYGLTQEQNQAPQTDSPRVSFTTEDVLSQQKLLIFDGDTLSVPATAYDAAQEPIANFARSLASADKQAMGDIVSYLRAASGASSDGARDEDLHAAITAAEQAISTIDAIEVPNTLDVQTTTSATARSLVRSCNSIEGDLVERWEKILSELKAISAGGDDAASLDELDKEAHELGEEVSQDLVRLLADSRS